MPKLFRRQPTKMMIELLMEIHERELMNLPPFRATHRSVPGLYMRNLIRVDLAKDEQGKRNLCIFITKKGESYLERLSSV